MGKPSMRYYMFFNRKGHELTNAASFGYSLKLRKAGEPSKPMLILSDAPNVPFSSQPLFNVHYLSKDGGKTKHGSSEGTPSMKLEEYAKKYWEEKYPSGTPF